MGRLSWTITRCDVVLYLTRIMILRSWGRRSHSQSPLYFLYPKLDVAKSILLALVLGILFYRMLTKPILRLSKAVQSIEPGKPRRIGAIDDLGLPWSLRVNRGVALSCERKPLRAEAIPNPPRVWSRRCADPRANTIVGPAPMSRFHALVMSLA